MPAEVADSRTPPSGGSSGNFTASGDTAVAIVSFLFVLFRLIRTIAGQWMCPVDVPSGCAQWTGQRMCPVDGPVDRPTDVPSGRASGPANGCAQWAGQWTGQRMCPTDVP